MPAKIPDLRKAEAPYERMVNAHQRALVRLYDSWSTQTRQRLLLANQRGARLSERQLILEASLTTLQNALIDQGRRGIIAASRIAVPKEAQLQPGVRGITLQLVGANNQMVRDAMPGIAAALTARMEAFPARPLFDVFITERSGIASQAGMAWQTVFQVQRIYGIQSPHV